MPTVCDQHGDETRLKCATCDKPICNRCLVQTRVGFKCHEHGLVADVPRPPERGRQTRQPGVGRPMGFLVIIAIMFLGFPILTVGLAALFAIVGDRTGIVSVLPLFAVLALLTVATLLFARRVMRS